MNLNWFDIGLFDMAQFSPHGFCLAWEPGILALTITGNAMIALSYVIIPVQLLVAVISNSGGELSLTKDKTLMALFAAFIFLCGTSHFIDILTIWLPIYGIQAYWLCLTGVVSLTTAAMTQYLFVRRSRREVNERLENERLLRENAFLISDRDTGWGKARAVYQMLREMRHSWANAVMVPNSGRMPPAFLPLLKDIPGMPPDEFEESMLGHMPLKPVNPFAS